MGEAVVKVGTVGGVDVVFYTKKIVAQIGAQMAHDGGGTVLYDSYAELLTVLCDDFFFFFLSLAVPHKKTQHVVVVVYYVLYR